MQQLESLILLLTVKTETNALSTIAILFKDAKLWQNSFLKIAIPNLQDVKEMYFACKCSEVDVSKSQPDLANLKSIMNAILKTEN